MVEQLFLPAKDLNLTGKNVSATFLAHLHITLNALSHPRPQSPPPSYRHYQRRRPRMIGLVLQIFRLSFPKCHDT